MSRKYKFHNPDGLYFISFAVQGWVDVFTRNEYKDILLDNLAYCQKQKGLEIFARCIMSNHVHMIAKAEGNHTLSEILRDFKKFTCKAIFKAISSDYYFVFQLPDGTPTIIIRLRAKHFLMVVSENYSESRREMLLKQFSTTEGIRFWRSDNKPVELWSNAVITRN